MPIFMDRHEVPGLTAMDVAEGHRQDLKIQHKFDCRALTYWYDEKRGMAFCLIEAPQKDAVEKLHEHSHGLIPNQIIEVESSVVEAFLGRIKNPEAGDGSDFQNLIDSAFRTIMGVQFDDALIKSKLGYAKGFEYLRSHNEHLHKVIELHQGREGQHAANSFIISFSSVTKAMECAVDIQKHFEEYNSQTSNVNIHMTIGLSAGDPVTEREEFFGEAIRFANRLCYIAEDGQIMVSSVVNNQYKQEGLDALSEENAIRILKPDEEKFLNRLMDVTEKFWNEEKFDVVEFSRQMGLSKSQLYRQITSLTGYSPNRFIKEFRLNKAIELIESQKPNISEISYETGFSSPSYFSNCFQERFGVLPSDYAQTIV